MLGALATATIAAPLASAAADQGVAVPAGVPVQAAQAAAVPAPAPAEAARTLALPTAVADAAPTQYSDAVASGSLTATAPVQPPASGTEAASEFLPTGDVAELSSGWAQPAPGAPITSPFGYRVHPTLGYNKMHDGVDFGAACGTTVHAAQAGTVIEAGWNDVSGKRVKILHADGSITDYFHLSAISVNKGDTVTKGQEVGKVGSTGRSTGCHLHFGLEKGAGNYVNPMTLWQ